MILTENCVNAASTVAVIDVDYFHRNALPRSSFHDHATTIVPALCLATGVAGLSAYAAYAASTAADPPMESPAASDAGGPHHWRHGHPGGPLGEMGFVLHKLNLSAEEKASIKQIFAEQKSQFEALRASSKSNREALASTPPTDAAAYGALVKTAQTNASTRIRSWARLGPRSMEP